MKNSGFDKTIGNQTPILNGGSLKTKLNEESKEVKAEIEAEKEEKEAKEAKEKAEKLKEELREKQRKPSDGSEIAAPIPNHLAYSRLVTKNQRLITELLNRLKQIVKPKTQRTIFQKKGRLMSNILAQAYTNSFNRIVENIYVKTESIYEKQKVAIAFLFDSSGSVNKTKLFDCMTVLNEVFGQYLSDSEFSIANFGTNLQRVKTFSETYENTKARIPAVDCGFDNNEMINTLLESYLKQFNGISKEYKKICCIISDFQLLIGKEGFETIINKLIDAKVQPFFIGIDGWQYAINLYMHNDKRVKRVGVSDISQLPNLFLKIYLEGIQGIN